MDRVSIIIEGLDCPNCSMKLEKNIRKLKYIEDVDINLIKQEILITYQNAEKNILIKDIEKILNSEDMQIISIDNKDYVNKGRRQNLCANSCCSCDHHEHHHGHNHEHSHEHNHEHNHEHSHEHVHKNSKYKLLVIILGIFFYFVALLNITEPFVTLGFFIVSYILLGIDIVLKAIKNIFNGNFFDENFLMAVSTLGALAIGQYPEAIAVMLFYKIGEYCQDIAVNKSRKSIKSLMNLKPEYANLIGEKGDIIKTDPQNINIGDIILIKPGEKVALDGIIIEGKSQLDTSELTGESIPLILKENDKVLSGVINLTGTLKVKVSKIYKDSTVAKVMDMVENASSKKSKTENFITKFSKIYTPAVVFMAIIIAFIPPLFLNNSSLQDWIYRGLVFLVVSCPCALVISVPLSFFSGIGLASKNGILIKGSNYLQEIAEIKTIIFDKTGTLTKGVFDVTDIYCEDSITQNELLEIAASVEVYSNHPIAKSILRECKNRNIEIKNSEINNFKEISGKGLEGILEDSKILIGNSKILDDNKIDYKKYDGIGTVIYILKDNKYKGYIVVSDIIKEDAEYTINKLKEKNISIGMLTGDRKENANKISQKLGIDLTYSELLPNEKVEIIENLYLENKDQKIAFIGDGINDAPVLSRVNVGIAMGALGSEVAIESADIVLMTDEPSKIIKTIDIAKITMKTVKQNIYLALFVKFAVLILSVFGFASMWLAVFADVGVTLIVILNSIRKTIYKYNL